MKIRAALIFVSSLGLTMPIAAPSMAQQSPNTASQIDYGGFEQLTLRVAGLRSERLLNRSDFFDHANADGALLLDTRSAEAFAAGHIAGAVNLPFSDFTEEKLLEVIGEDNSRAIYIYCNNNFSDDVAPIPLKKAPLALNIPTFINLVGYGYENVWELGESMPVDDVDWVSTTGTEP